MTLPLEALYRDIILDHYRSPRGSEPLERTDVSCRGRNPACGDDLTVGLHIVDGTIKQASIKTKGCAISIASSSMLAETIEGKSLTEAAELGEIVRKMMRGEDIPDDIDLGDLDSLRGVRNFPVRVKCALLAWIAMLGAIKDYNEGKSSHVVSVTTE